jgi:hypothetical protein
LEVATGAAFSDPAMSKFPLMVIVEFPYWISGLDTGSRVSDVTTTGTPLYEGVPDCRSK